MATTDKYDRQLRLWGAKGQRCLGETTVVLIRATAAGTETLKNLVLPGIGRIWIIDDCNENQGDSNFFTPYYGGGASRAQTALEHLTELNPDVKGQYTQLPSLQNDWDGQPITTASNDKLLVIASDLEPPLLLQVSKLCAQHKVPLIAVENYGLLGYVRLQAPPMPLLEPKPENEPPDLRLVSSFPELQQLAASIDWASLTDQQHGHVPYPLILLKLQSDWKQSHNDQLPTSFAEKQKFRDSIRAMARKYDHELNFQEATQNAYLAYTEKTLDDYQFQELLQKSEACPKLKMLLVALQTFVKMHNRAPLHGTIPDMTASTDLYVGLQRLYHDQAANDAHDMKQILQTMQPPTAVINAVADEDVITFCKNVFSLDVLTTRTLEQEMTASTATTSDLIDEWNMALMDPYEAPEHTPFLWYMALRGCRVFYQQHGRYPGTTEEFAQDAGPLQKCMVQVAHEMQLHENELVRQTLMDVSCKYAQEMMRYGQAEIHNIASVVGGVASQEAVKMITGQYVPLNNTYIYNGIASTGGVYEF